MTISTWQHAADIVADPSAPNAFVQGIMEGKEWVWNNGMILEQDRWKSRTKWNVMYVPEQTNYQTLVRKIP